MKTSSSFPQSEPRRPPTRDEFLALVGRAVEDGGDSICELQQLLDRNEGLCQSLSDLERATEHHLIKLAAGKLRSSRHTMERLIAQIRDGHLGDGDGAFERFLVHRFIVSYLEVIIRQKRVMTAATAAEKHNLAQLGSVSKPQTPRSFKYLLMNAILIIPA